MIVGANCQEGAELRCVILAIANIFKTAWVHRKALFLKKKVAK
jgi:hypothetical protein